MLNRPITEGWKTLQFMTLGVKVCPRDPVPALDQIVRMPINNAHADRKGARGQGKGAPLHVVRNGGHERLGQCFDAIDDQVINGAQVHDQIHISRRQRVGRQESVDVVSQVAFLKFRSCHAQR